MCNYPRKPYEGCVIFETHEPLDTTSTVAHLSNHNQSIFEALWLIIQSIQGIVCFIGYEAVVLFPAVGQPSRTGRGAAAPSAEISHCPGPCARFRFNSEINYEFRQCPMPIITRRCYPLPGWFENLSGYCASVQSSEFALPADFRFAN
jgi:hypothetical protein